MSTRANPAATLFPLLLAGLLAGMSYWLELASRAPTAANDGKSRHDPDFIVKNFEVRRFDPQGNLQHTIVADLMRHYPDDDSTAVLAPRITYHRTPPTFVSAREALISSKGEHVELIDDVRVTRSGAGNKPDTVLTTTRLEAWPDDEIAKSNVPVTITQGPTSVQGSGLSVDNKTSFYVLEGPVRGVFFRTAKLPSATAPPAALASRSAPASSKTTPKASSKPKPQAKSKPKSKPKSSR
jgi:lipopolysaccharide export system protein LptC